jgi:hypothetical protein
LACGSEVRLRAQVPTSLATPNPEGRSLHRLRQLAKDKPTQPYFDVAPFAVPLIEALRSGWPKPTAWPSVSVLMNALSFRLTLKRRKEAAGEHAGYREGSGGAGAAAGRVGVWV